MCYYHIWRSAGEYVQQNATQFTYSLYSCWLPTCKYHIPILIKVYQAVFLAGWLAAWLVYIHETNNRSIIIDYVYWIIIGKLCFGYERNNSYSQYNFQQHLEAHNYQSAQIDRLPFGGQDILFFSGLQYTYYLCCLSEGRSEIDLCAIKC